MKHKPVVERLRFPRDAEMGLERCQAIKQTPTKSLSSDIPESYCCKRISKLGMKMKNISARNRPIIHSLTHFLAERQGLMPPVLQSITAGSFNLVVVICLISLLIFTV